MLWDLKPTDLEPIRDDPAFRALIAEFPRPATPKP